MAGGTHVEGLAGEPPAGFIAQVAEDAVPLPVLWIHLHVVQKPELTANGRIGFWVL